ncbi:MAG: DUF4160 domain-containing protein [Candidatus Binatia bacterium]|jgi:hypothetical protein
MLVISMFYGLIVSMFFVDRKRHKLPHVHVRYQNQEAVFSIPQGRVLDGSLPKAKVRLVQAWIEIHREELVADWSLAVEGQPVFKIDPLK